MASEFDEDRYLALINNGQHEAAIAYVDGIRGEYPDDPKFKRLAALARGGKGERILGSMDQVGVVPSQDRIAELIELFQEAISIDPSLADPYWDLAVIHGRFTNDLDQARQHLSQARKLGYQHPMMSQLEEMLHPQ